MKILVIEDNATNRKLCRAILTQSGFQVIEAVNGAEGLEAARSELPDLILMDIQMPVMDGREALIRIQADASAKNIPIVALTSYAMKGDKEIFLKDGFVDYLAKPIDIDKFLEIIRRHIARASSSG